LKSCRDLVRALPKEPLCHSRIHLDDAAIQSAFTSLILRLHLRRGGTVHKPYGADVIPDGRYEMNGTKVLGLAAVAAVLVMASPVQRAGAASLINPGAATAVQDDTRQLTTEVRWGHHHGWHRGWHHRRHWGWRHRWHRRHW
jgi:hypothetical protein